MDRLLETITKNRIFAFLFGTGLTAIVQSSSAITVLAVGLVNSGIIELSRALGLIIGANLGTTATAWILSLNAIDGESLLMTIIRDSTVYTDICYALEQLIDYCDMIAEALIRYEIETGRTLAEDAGTNEKTRQQIHEIFLDKFKAFEREAE